MRSERLAGFSDRFDQGVGKLLVSEMLAHSFNQLLPETLAALFMDRFIADDRELVCAGRDENQDGVSFWRFVHSEPMKFFLRGDQRIDIYLAALNKNTNLAGRF